MSCEELRAQEATLVSQAADLEPQIADARTNIIDDSSHAAHWKAVLAALEGQLSQVRQALAGVEAQIAVECLPHPPASVLTSASIRFDTHNDNKDTRTVVHVFVRNRARDTSTPMPEADYVSNKAAWDWFESRGTSERNPYLAIGEGLGVENRFDDGSTHSFPLSLRSAPVPLTEVDLPMVDVHILTDVSQLIDGGDRWILSWTVTLEFSGGQTLTATSDTDGVAGVVIDQDNSNHCGLGTENPFFRGSERVKPATDAVLAQVDLSFYTHDDAKLAGTAVNVHLVNRLAADQHQDIAVASNILPDTPFDHHSVHSVTFSADALPLSLPALAMRDVVLPMVFIVIAASDDDRWAFDYQVAYTFSDGRTFTSRTSGVVLTRLHPKHAGIYRGAPFPTVAPSGRPPLFGPAVDHSAPGAEKRISVASLRQKLDEFVNFRQGIAGQLPPLRRLRLDNSGLFDVATLPESFYDFQAIEADAPPPGTVTPPEHEDQVLWRSHPTSLGQLTEYSGIGDTYLSDVNSRELKVTFDPAQDQPISVWVDFETDGLEVVAFGNVSADFTSFSILVRLSLTGSRGGIDLFSWVEEVQQATDDWSDVLDRFVQVRVTAGLADFGGAVQKNAREKIYHKLIDPDPLDGTTLRDKINKAAAAFFLGAPPATEFTDGCRVQSLDVTADEIVIRYTGPEHTFVPPMPPGWPQAFDLSPATLSAIDHIVILTMENRSFDHMLGYLSLPTDQGGQGRTNVDGLTGDQANTLDGVTFRVFPLAEAETIFAPDPDHGYEPVARAINDGKMDGFVKSYADKRGRTVAPRIMGYHTALNLPVYDALARDFAVGHRWFASHPGPTFPNRYYELTGRPNIDDDGYWEFDDPGSVHPVPVPTIFDHLTDAGVTWAYFENGGYSTLRLFERYTFGNPNVVAFDHPGLGFLNRAAVGALPSVSFIDPHFVELPPGANCDGPPADVRRGQEFVEQIVNAVVAGPQWDKTLLVIVYDEHGGFYDHIAPPDATPISSEPGFPATYGVRVPAIVVSPWVTPGAVFGHDLDGTGKTLHFDHTSILKTIVRRFLSQDPPAMGARYATADDLSSIVQPTMRPGPFRPFIPYTLTCESSAKTAEIRGGAPSAGAVVQQATSVPTDAQRFCFEDAGSGLFHIRTRSGGQYWTAGPDHAITLQAKGTPGSSLRTAQRWRLTSVSISILHPNLYVIANEAFPGLVLQPQGDGTAEHLPLMLAPPAVNPHGTLNRWTVESPLLPGGLSTHPF